MSFEFAVLSLDFLNYHCRMGILNKLFPSHSSNIKWYKVFDSILEAEKNIVLNKAVTVLVEDTKICLIRTLVGYTAVADTCPHLGASLSKGVCNHLGEIVCPWHSYRFDTKLGHETSGQGAGLGVEIYKVDIRTDGLYIGI